MDNDCKNPSDQSEIKTTLDKKNNKIIYYHYQCLIDVGNFSAFSDEEAIKKTPKGTLLLMRRDPPYTCLINKW